MLPEVTVGAEAGGILQHQSLLAVFLCDDVDHTGDGIRAVERGGCSLDNLDTFDIVGVDEREVVLAAIVTMEPAAVDEDEYIGVAQAIHLQAGTHVVLAEVETCRQSREDVLDGASRILLELPVADDLGLHRGILQQMLCASAGHHHLLQAVRPPDIGLSIRVNTTYQEAQAESQSLHISHQKRIFRAVYSCTGIFYK